MRTRDEQVLPARQHHSPPNCCHAAQYCLPTPWPACARENAIDLLLLDYADDCTYHAERPLTKTRPARPWEYHSILTRGLKCGPWEYHSVYHSTPLLRNASGSRAVESEAKGSCNLCVGTGCKCIQYRSTSSQQRVADQLIIDLGMHLGV